MTQAPPTSAAATHVADVVALGSHRSSSSGGGHVGRMLGIALAALLALAATALAGASADAGASFGAARLSRRLAGFTAAGLLAAGALAIALTSL